MSEFTTIDVVGAGPRGALTLNRPDKLNPLSSTTLAEIAEAARWFDRHPAIKVVVVVGQRPVVLRGRRSRCVRRRRGGRAATERTPRDNADLGRLMADAVEAMSAVTVARIHGHCIGGGVVLAAACDLRVAASDAYFSIPEVDLGIPLAWGGIPRLVREIGPALTKELVMTCRPFTAAEAQAAGFVNRVAAPDELDQEVEELVAQLLTKSSLTLKATKRHVDAVTRSMVSLDRSWADADSLVAALRDPESRESAAAYLQRVRKK